MPFNMKTFVNSGAALASACAFAAITNASPAAASETWRFERSKGGGYAQSCQNRRGGRFCATVFCGRGTDGWGIGVMGWEPRRGDGVRVAQIEVDGRGRELPIIREANPITGPIWRVDTPGAGNRLVDRIQAGRSLSMDVARRRAPIVFTLNGSHDAIAQLERRCERVAWGGKRRARPDNEIAEGLRIDRDGFVIGNDDFQLRFDFGKPEEKGRLSRRQIRRVMANRGFRRVTDIDYRPRRDVYAVKAVNRRGVPVRVIVDADSGKFRRIRRL